MKFENELKIHCLIFYGGLTGLFAWLFGLIIIALFFLPITNPYLGIGFLLWGAISASAVIIEAENFGAGCIRSLP